ncbi:MAG: nitroreductase family protein [Rikenellaceae bacterium]
MKNQWKIISILLSAVIIILSLTIFENREPKELKSEKSDQDIILNSIATRTSVRKFTNQKIEAAKIEQILKVGMSAPTAGNRQPWEFYVVSDTTLIKQFPKVTRYTSPMHKTALTAIIVCGNPSKSFPKQPLYWVQDCSAATENILLAAHAMDLGAVWCGVYPVEKSVATLREMMNIPDELVPLNIIMLGYPDAEQKVKDKWKPEKVHYIN